MGERIGDARTSEQGQASKNEQLGLFGTPEAPRPSSRAKCRRATCGHSAAKHAHGTGISWCKECVLLGLPPCQTFIDAADIAKPKKAPSAKGREYCDAYAAGIRDAAPAQEFSVSSSTGAILGRIASVHAKSNGAALTGPDLVAWFRRRAAEFRRATTDRPELWGGWAPFHFERWLNMGAGGSTRQSALQPMPAGGLRVISRSLGKK